MHQCLSRDGLSFCIADNYLAVRNLKKKQFEIVDIQTEKVMVEHTYEDPWYYNNYHVLGNIFVFPHLNKVTFFDSANDFKSLQYRGVDFQWYKNDS